MRASLRVPVRMAISFLIFLLATARAWCGDPTWQVLIEPKFEKHEVAFQIPKATRAELVPAVVKNGETVALSKKEFDALKVDWATFLASAVENASATVKNLTPEYTRDKRKIIQFATITSETPLTAGVILSPDFLKMFTDTIGDKVVIVIPNRFTVYIFPAIGGHYQDYTQMVYEAYHATGYPVSMEAYELSDKGLKTIGLFQDP